MYNEEIWKDFNKYYSVSNQGRIRNKATQHILAQNINGGGYFYATLANPKYNLTVHRAIAAAFVENPLLKPQVNHIDGNKLNNAIDNLEWVTQEENLSHAVLNKLMPSGTDSYLAKLNEASVEKIKLAFVAGIKSVNLAKEYKVDRGTISAIFKGRTWKHVRPDLIW